MLGDAGGVTAPMSNSYPTIQDSLSEVQKDFMGCVEMHLDPPDHDALLYSVESLWTCDEPEVADVPGEAIRFKLEVAEVDEDDLTERRHVIEFLDEESGEPRGWIRHRMKRAEAQHGRYVWTESRFEVGAPGLPEGQARQAEVEREVTLLVDKIRLLDRARTLVEAA